MRLTFFYSFSFGEFLAIVDSLLLLFVLFFVTAKVLGTVQPTLYVNAIATKLRVAQRSERGGVFYLLF